LGRGEVTVAILDTTVIVHIFRKDHDALGWFTNQSTNLSITPITWMEFMVGVPNKRAQADSLKLLRGFEMLYMTASDMEWAMQQMLLYRFSKGIGIMDCFNASVCHRLNVPILTHNVKHYLKILPAHLVTKPY
jgi:predicted nucleic acid-binding protein